MSYISAELSKDRSEVLVWKRENGKRVTERFPSPLYFYVENPKGEYESIYGKKLSKYEFNDYREFYQTKQDLLSRKIKLYESDIRPEYKILSSFYDKESHIPNITFYDIEVDYDPKKGGLVNAKPDNPISPINAISIYHRYSDKSIVYVVPPKGEWDRKRVEKLNELCPVILCKDEKELLEYFLEEIEETDILSGWNSMSYDDPYIYERLKRVISPFAANKLSFNESGKDPYYKEVMNKFKIPQNKLITSGRVLLDYMELFIKFQLESRDSYSLDSIAEEELDIRKISFDGSLHSLYNNEFHTFVLYSIRDTEILKGFEDKFGYMTTAISMAHLNTCQILDVLGTTKQTEMAIINHAHENNKIVPDSVEIVSNGGKFKGAFVVPTIPGLYEWIDTIDVTSLYPSTMRTLNLSPETIVGQFYDQHMAFDELLECTDKELTVLYENEMSETKTAKEWREYLIDANWAITAAGTIIDQTKEGIMSSILTRWFKDRQKYKKDASKFKDLMLTVSKDSLEYKEYFEKYKFYDRLQNIKKLSLNSFYGACGNEFFKFYDLRLAESTTRSGERILRHMLKTVGKKMGGSYEFPNNYIVAGDTDSAMFLTEADNLEDALLVGTIIQKAINNSTPKFLMDNFCILEKNSHNISVEFENVGKRAIFVKRKNYIINLAHKDGKNVDEFKIRGLQIKKTGLPKYVRQDLTEFMKIFLRGKPWKELGLDIVNYRESIIMKDNVLDIGLPIQIKNIEEYYEKYSSRNKNEPLSKLRLPGHVAAAILWNELLKENNDTESMNIISGMKIKRFYLKNKINDLNSIAVPTDTKILPQWFYDKISDNIDRNKQVIRLVDNPLIQILSAINEELPTKQLLLIDSEFE